MNWGGIPKSVLVKVVITPLCPSNWLNSIETCGMIVQFSNYCITWEPVLIFICSLGNCPGGGSRRKLYVHVHPLGNEVHVCFFCSFLWNFPIISFVDYFHYLWRWNLLPSNYNYHFLGSVDHIFTCEPVLWPSVVYDSDWLMQWLTVRL